jgi:two-component system, NarL family, sensor kinase
VSEHVNSNGQLSLDAPFFRSLLDSLEVGVAIAERSGKILYANPRFAELLAGSPCEQVSGVELKNFVLATSWAQLSDALLQAAHRPTEGQMTVLPSGTGDQRIINLSLTPHDARNGTHTIRIVATEVTELVAANRALKQSEASLQTISARLLQVQDEERRRMARDLHDVTGQELAVCVMSLDNLEKLADTPGADLKRPICQSAQLLRKVDAEIRTLSYLLHPPLLDEMGLGSALSWFIDGFSKRTGIEVNTEIPEKLPRLALELETAIFRVVQEALTNVFRHSGSHRAWVSLSAKESHLQVSVEDEGTGFDKKKVGAKSKQTGLGIQSMRDRLRTFRGTLEFRALGPGTQVVATIPLTKEARSLAIQPASLDQDLAAATEDTLAAAGGAKRILVADDHEVARQGIRVLLKDECDLEICGEAKDGVDALDKAKQLNPDLVIMDLSMPNMNGFSAVKHIRAAGLATKILIYTTHSYPGLEHVAQAAGCDGFVVKSNASQDLIRGVRTVLNGGRFYSHEESAKAVSVPA